MRYIIRCLKCGWSEESDFVASVHCPNCNDHLVINDSEYDNQIANIAEKIKHQAIKFRKVNANNTNDQIGMFKNIDTLGHAQCWEVIEAIKDPFVRLSHRKLFITVGGQIPERS